MNIKVDKNQLDDLLKKASPQRIVAVVKDLIKEASDVAHHAALHNIQGGTKQAGYSIRAEVKTMSAKIHSLMPQARAMSIEIGRKQGEVIPYMQAARFVTGRRYLTARRAKSLSEEDNRNIGRLQESVRKHGTKPKHFIAGAYAVVNSKMPDIMNNAAARIERGWRG